MEMSDILHVIIIIKNLNKLMKKKCVITEYNECLEYMFFNNTIIPSINKEIKKREEVRI